MPNRSVDFQFLAEPTDVNFGGKVHGGMMMKWMDQAGYACAVGWSGQYCMTVSVGAIRFRNPVLVGQLVHLHAKVVHTGNSSIHVFITVEALDPKTQTPRETNHCIITFVAVDDAGERIKVPTWSPDTADDYLLEEYAIRMKFFSTEAEELLANRQTPFAVGVFDHPDTYTVPKFSI
jgi:acyl-CoA hydrolase